MSRVGKKPIEVPKNVQVTFADGLCTVKGPKGELRFGFDERIAPKQEGTTLVFERANDEKKVRALHGLTRAHIAWMVEGVSNGFEKKLQVEGVGFKVELRGKNLLLNLGYSHPIMFMPPDGIEFAVASPTAFSVKGIDKQLVGVIAAKLRDLRKPEPYKGKGVRYEGEYIRRKAGKSAGK
ncbi:MAG: 50S ribosomal protein L6 [Bradyrhizobiaceae bacterium]|nr:50S ribosomal protein L6 [Bradyrhizobiaceae bacterium]